MEKYTEEYYKHQFKSHDFIVASLCNLEDFMEATLDGAPITFEGRSAIIKEADKITRDIRERTGYNATIKCGFDEKHTIYVNFRIEVQDDHWHLSAVIDAPKTPCKLCNPKHMREYFAEFCCDNCSKEYNLIKNI